MTDADDIESARYCVARVRRSMSTTALGEALAGPVAAWCLFTAGLLAATRALDAPEAPVRVIALGGIAAAAAATMRYRSLRPTLVRAALRLDADTDARGRWLSVADATTPPAVLAWAARGALQRTTPESFQRSCAVEPPRALPAALLAATLMAGLLLLVPPPSGLPAPARDVATTGGDVSASGSSPHATSRSVATSAAPASAVRGPRPAPVDPREPDLRETLDGLRRRAGTDPAAADALRRAAAALAEGDEDAARAALRDAARALGVLADPSEEGRSGGSVASAGEVPVTERPPPFPVPLRAREAVRRYFAARDVEEIGEGGGR